LKYFPFGSSSVFDLKATFYETLAKKFNDDPQRQLAYYLYNDNSTEFLKVCWSKMFAKIASQNFQKPSVAVMRLTRARTILVEEC